MKSSIAQRLSKLGVGLESADLMVQPEDTPVVDPTTTDVVDTLALTDAQSEVDEAEGVLDRLQEDHSELSEVAAALESFLASADPISPMVASALAIPARRATKAYGLSNSIPSVESFGSSQEAIRTNLRASLEATESRMTQFVKWIKDVFRMMLDKVVSMWDHFTSFITRQGDMARAIITAIDATHSSLKASTTSATANTKSDITIPAALVKQLSLKGSYAGDIESAYGRVKNLVEAQLVKASPLVIDVHADNLMALQEIMDEVRHAKADADLSSIVVKVEEMSANMASKMPEAFEKAAKSLDGADIQHGKVTLAEVLGGVQFVMSFDETTSLVSVNAEQLDVQDEDVTVEPMSLDKTRDLADAVSAVCKVIWDYQNTNSARKKMLADLEKLVKEAESLHDVSPTASGFASGMTSMMSVSLKTAVAMERPLINYVTRVNRAALAVCKLTIGAYGVGKGNLGLPAPAKA